MSRYAIYQPSKGQLHLVNYPGELPEGDTYVIVLYRPEGVDEKDEEAVMSTLRAIKYHYLEVGESDV